MAETSQFESDAFLKLLTDALRAGPGSPQWHEAVTQLRSANPAEADEYRLLITAREHLESGREYRSVRAGPGFTRRVMERIEEEAGGSRPALPSANLVAILAALGIVAMIVAVAVILLRGSAPGGTLAELAAMEFTKTAVAGDFWQGIGAGWKRFGLEPVISPREKALRGGYQKDNEREYKSGGIHMATAIPAEQSFAVEATARMNRPTGQVDLQFFMSEDPKADKAREFVLDLRSGQLSAYMPDGTSAGEAVTISDGKDGVALLIKMNRQFVVVECDRKQLYAGPHGLSAQSARWPGVRFLTRGPEKGLDDVTVQMMRVLKP